MTKLWWRKLLLLLERSILSTNRVLHARNTTAYVRPRMATGQTGEQGDGANDADRKRKRHSDAQLVYTTTGLRVRSQSSDQ